MKISDLIAKMEALKNVLGDIEIPENSLEIVLGIGKPHQPVPQMYTTNKLHTHNEARERMGLIYRDGLAGMDWNSIATKYHVTHQTVRNVMRKIRGKEITDLIDEEMANNIED